MAEGISAEAREPSVNAETTAVAAITGKSVDEGEDKEQMSQMVSEAENSSAVPKMPVDTSMALLGARNS